MRCVAAVLAVSVGLAVASADDPVPQRPGSDPRDGEAVRQWGLANGWTEVVPPPITPRYRPTEADARRGFLAYVPDMDDTEPVDRLPAAPVQRTLTAIAFPGEFEGLTLAVHALKDLESVKVEVTDLAGPTGSVIRAATVQVRDMICAPLSLRHRRQRENRFVMRPLWLLDHAPAPLAAGRGRRFRLTVPVPADALAGRYTGMVILTCAAGPAARATPEPGQARVPITLDVQPFRLDGSLCSWVPVTGGNGFDLHVYRQMAEHHMTGLSWWWGHWGLTVRRDGDRASFDPAPLDLLNAVTREAGMRGPWILMLGNMVRGHLERRLGGYYPGRRVAPLFDVRLVQRPRAPAGAEPDVGDLGDPEISRRYVEVLKALADRAKAKGYPEIIIIPYDEPNAYLADWNTHWSDLIRKEVPQFKVLNTPQGVVRWARRLMPESDLMVVRGADDPIYDMAVKAGKRRIGYGRLTANQTLAQARHGLALRFAEQQPKVIFFWSLNFGTLDARTPFNDLNERDSGFRHRFAWPPLNPGRPWIETVHWEMFREGAKDYLLLLMLDDALAQSKSARATRIAPVLKAFKHEAARDPSNADQRRAQLVKWYREVLGDGD